MILILIAFGFSFEIGEDLEYEAKFGFLNVGRMTLSIPAETLCGNDTVYHFNSEITSNPRYKMLFSLNDRLDSYSRVSDLRPLIFKKEIQEGRYEATITVNFDHENLKAYYSDSSEVTILPMSFDLLGFYYRLRTLDIAFGDTVIINNHADKKNYSIKVTALWRERVKTKIGEWDCILYEPQTKEKGIFGKDGKLHVWISDDSLRVPVMIKSRMSLGSLTFRLIRCGWEEVE